ncbi:MAG: c-type cytochrome [Candidatus Eisenbacteria bacterium]
MKILSLLVRGLVLLTTLLILLALAAIGRGYWLLHRVYDRPVAARSLSVDSVKVARGAHLAALSCSGCHSPDHGNVLSGSAGNFAAEPTPKMGTLWAPNLTASGVLAAYSDAEIERAMREGIRRDGTALVVMPSVDLRWLSPSDMDAILAFLHSQPRVDRVLPARHLNASGYLFVGAGLIPTSVQERSRTPAEVPEEPGAEYGAYMVAVTGCRQCHGPTLHGGSAGPGMSAPDIASLAQQGSLKLFERAVRMGVGHDGRALDPQRMPWITFRTLSDVEMASIYEYARTRRSER